MSAGLRDKIAEFKDIIHSSDNIVFFGGAGVSTESGIPDFRSESGIFKSLEKYRTSNIRVNIANSCCYVNFFHKNDSFVYIDII